MQRRQNAYPPTSYNIQPQNIPLQQRQGYQPGNSNLQTPANAHQIVGRSRIPDNYSPSSPVSPRGAPTLMVSPRNASPNSPVSPRGASPNFPVSPGGASPNSPVSPRGVSPNLMVSPRGASPNSPVSPRGATQPVPTSRPHNAHNVYYDGDQRQNYQNNSNNNNNSNNYYPRNNNPDYQPPQAPYRQASANSSTSDLQAPAYLQQNSRVPSSSSSSTLNQSRGLSAKRFSVTPSTGTTGTTGTGVTEKFNLSPTSSHHLWDNDAGSRETDDDLHDPNEVIQGKDRRCVWRSKRGCLNVAALVLILFGILGLLGAYPVYTAIKNQSQQSSNKTVTTS